MSDIRSTITDTLGESVVRSYSSYVEQTVSALTEREDAIKEGLSEFAVGKGLRESEVEALFIEVGLSPEPAPEPEAIVSSEGQSVEAMIASLSEQISALSTRLDNAANAAARHGVRF